MSMGICPLCPYTVRTYGSLYSPTYTYMGLFLSCNKGEGGKEAVLEKNTQAIELL